MLHDRQPHGSGSGVGGGPLEDDDVVDEPEGKDEELGCDPPLVEELLPNDPDEELLAIDPDELLPLDLDDPLLPDELEPLRDEPELKPLEEDMPAIPLCGWKEFHHPE